MELVILDDFGHIRNAMAEVDCKDMRFAIYNIEDNVLECASDNAPPEIVQRLYRLSEADVEYLREEVDDETPHVILGYKFGSGKAYAIAATHDLCEASAAMCEVATVCVSASAEVQYEACCSDNGTIVITDMSGRKTRLQIEEDCPTCLKFDDSGPSIYSLEEEDFEDDDENIGQQLRRLSIFRHSKR